MPEKDAPTRKKMERPQRCEPESAGSIRSKKKTMTAKMPSVRNCRRR
jgi:hypothetical protein